MVRNPKAGAPDPPDPTVQRLVAIADEAVAIEARAEGRAYSPDEVRRITDLHEEFTWLEHKHQPRIAAARLKLRLVGT
jgi:hypothetical protein